MDELKHKPHKQNPHLYQKGQSGNAIGRPKGSRNHLTLLRENIKPYDLGRIMRKAIELAIGGNVSAMRLVVNIILRTRRDGPINVDLPELKNAQDVLAAMQKVASEVGAGELTAAQGADLARVFDLFLHALGHLDLERRVRAFEQLGIVPVPVASLPKPGA